MPSSTYPSIEWHQLAAVFPSRRSHLELAVHWDPAMNSCRQSRTAPADENRPMQLRVPRRCKTALNKEQRPRRAHEDTGVESRRSTRSRQCRFDAYGPSELESEVSELVGRSCISDLVLDDGTVKRVCPPPSHFSRITRCSLLPYSVCDM